jgi:autotransporter adhesin
MTDFQPPIVNVPIYNPNYFITQGESSVSSSQFVQFPVETRLQTFSDFTLENLVLGNGATGTGTNSIAIGKNANANLNDSVAIGRDAVVPSAGSVALGNEFNFFSFRGMPFQNVIRCIKSNENIDTQNNTARDLTWSSISGNTILTVSGFTTFGNNTSKPLTLIVSLVFSLDSPYTDYSQHAIIYFGGLTMRNTKLTQTPVIGRQVSVSAIIPLDVGDTFKAQYMYSRDGGGGGGARPGVIHSETTMTIMVF